MATLASTLCFYPIHSQDGPRKLSHSPSPLPLLRLSPQCTWSGPTLLLHLTSSCPNPTASLVCTSYAFTFPTLWQHWVLLIPLSCLKCTTLTWPASSAVKGASFSVFTALTPVRSWIASPPSDSMSPFSRLFS